MLPILHPGYSCLTRPLQRLHLGDTSPPRLAWDLELWSCCRYATPQTPASRSSSPGCEIVDAKSPVVWCALFGKVETTLSWLHAFLQERHCKVPCIFAVSMLIFRSVSASERYGTYTPCCEDLDSLACALFSGVPAS